MGRPPRTLQWERQKWKEDPYIYVERRYTSLSDSANQDWEPLTRMDGRTTPH